MSARISVAVAALLIGCSTAQSDPANDDREALAALDARRVEVEQVAVMRDADAFIDLFTPEVYLREPGMKFDGEQFRTFARDFFANGGILSLDLRPDKVHVHGDAAYEFGEYEEKAVFGTDTVSVANHYAMRWTRSGNGSWRIDHLTTGARAAP